MSSTHHAHACPHTSLPHVKKNPAKPSRSAPLPKTTVSTRAAVKGIKGAKAKSFKEGQKAVKDETGIASEDERMGSTFLQYWSVVHLML